MKKEQSTIEQAQNEFKDAQIFVSKKAVTRLKAVMSSEGKSGYYLRMSVDSGGCSGMNYKMDFDEKQNTYDKVFEQNGLNFESISTIFLQFGQVKLIFLFIC